jgi:hypothetical protein
MNQSEQINELMAALAKAQGQMRAAIKDSTNPHFKSRYADLASVWDACREPLSNNGLAVTQTVQCDGDKQFLVTMLGHASGQWIKSLICLPIQKPGPQELGSCLSYCRRYGLASMVGVFQDDDDGEKVEAPYRAPKTSAIPSLSASQISAIEAYLKDDHEAVTLLAEKYKPNWRDMPADKFLEVCNKLKERKEKREKDA